MNIDVTGLSIRRMARYGEHGWEFDITSTDPLTDKRGSTTYRTNGEGDGLWVYMPRNDAWEVDGSPIYEWRQQLGTCQFSLPESRSAAYAKVRREFRHL